MVPTGFFGILADQFYLNSLSSNNYRHSIVAGALFPFDRDILLAEPELYLRNKIVNEGVLDTINFGLKYDPYSARYLALATQYNLIFNKKNEASLNYEKLKKVVPNSSLVKAFKANF